MKNKKIYTKLLIILFGIYVLITLINQQKTLNTYNNNSKQLAVQLKNETEYKNELLATKENVNSLEYIEETAREKLDMYLPNERVYEDRGM